MRNYNMEYFPTFFQTGCRQTTRTRPTKTTRMTLARYQKKYHLINWSYLAWKEGGRYKRKPIGNREEYDSSSASNIPRRWNNYRRGTPGKPFNVKKLEHKQSMIDPRSSQTGAIFWGTSISWSTTTYNKNVRLTGTYCPRGTGVMLHPRIY